MTQKENSTNPNRDALKLSLALLISPPLADDSPKTPKKAAKVPQQISLSFLSRTE
jgi:hypothetical protein